MKHLCGGVVEASALCGTLQLFVRKRIVVEFASGAVRCRPHGVSGVANDAACRAAHSKNLTFLGIVDEASNNEFVEESIVGDETVHR